MTDYRNLNERNADNIRLCIKEILDLKRRVEALEKAKRDTKRDTKRSTKKVEEK